MQDSHSGDSTSAGAELGAFGKYHLIASLGQGGMASVYLALMAGPSDFHKLLVIKVMRQDLLAGAETGVRMFMAEARLAARLVHPNIVHTYEVGEHEGRFFLAMEHLDGQPLSTVLNRARGEQSIPLAEYLRALAELARGLHYAHTLRSFQGEPLDVVHRDVSPQNVIITYDGQVKLLDFGIAKTSEGEPLTQVGMFKGKLDYIAPEQLRAEQIDGRADVFALGAMLWEVVCGHRFAGGRRISDVDKMQARLVGGERKLRALRPDVPASLEAIVERAISLRPEDRYQTAAELADALESHLEEMQLRASPRVLAEHMQELFASERAELHKLVDDRVREVRRGSQPPDLVASSEPRAKLSLYLSEQHVDDRSSIRQLARALSTAPAPPPSVRGLVPALVLALTAGAAAMWFLMGSPRGVSVPPLPALVVPAPRAPDPGRPVTPSPLARATVRLRVAAEPADAQVTLDGIPLALPFEGAFAKDDANHRLEVSADGFRPIKQFVAFDRDLELSLELERLPSAPLKKRVATDGVQPNPY